MQQVLLDLDQEKRQRRFSSSNFVVGLRARLAWSERRAWLAHHLAFP